MIGICRLFSCSGMLSLFRPQACLLSVSTQHALSGEIVTKSRELVVPPAAAAAAAAIHVDCSDKRVCGRLEEKGKGEVLQQSLAAAVESDLPKV